MKTNNDIGIDTQPRSLTLLGAVTATFAVLIPQFWERTLGADALDTWYVRNSGTSEAFYDVTYGNGTFVVVSGSGVGLILSSSDGSNWIRRLAEKSCCGCVAFGGGRFVASASYDPAPLGPIRILTSTDGASWSSGSVLQGSRVPTLGAAYGAGRFLVVGGDSGEASWATSTDGTNWTNDRSQAFLGLTAVSFGSRKFVAVGYQGTILTSTDGLKWNSATFVTNKTLSGVAYDGRMFVAVGTEVALTSTNGIDWTIRYTGTNVFTALAYGDGLFIAGDAYGDILTSTNGVAWTRRSTGNAGHPISGVAVGPDSVVAVSSLGIILQSAPTRPKLSGRYQRGVGFALAATGGVQRAYRIEASSNLTAWASLGASIQPGTNYVDSAATTRSRRFYRILWP